MYFTVCSLGGGGDFKKRHGRRFMTHQSRGIVADVYHKSELKCDVLSPVEETLGDQYPISCEAY